MKSSTSILLAWGSGLLIVFSSVQARAVETGPKPETELDTILAKVRKAQRPAENMRIEWVCEKGAGGAFFAGRAPPPEKRPRLTKYKGSAILSGSRSRVEERQETYYGKDINEPGSILDHTYVFDGTEQRQLRKRTQGFQKQSSSGLIRFIDYNTHFLRQRLFGSQPLQLHKQELKDYGFKLSLADSNAAGTFIIKVVEPKGHSYHLLTVDSNKGYNIIKHESFGSSDGRKFLEDNLKLEEHPGIGWFISERERLRFRRNQAEPAFDEKLAVTSVVFDMPLPADDTFRLLLAQGMRVYDSSFYERQDSFPAGCLSEAKHTQEDSVVTAILDGQADKEESRDEAFGPLAEKMINTIQQRKDCLIDFDTNAIFSLPGDFHLRRDEMQKKWLEDNSIDTRVETDDGLCGLWTFNTVVIPVSNERWDTITPAACHRVLKEAKGVYPPIMSAEGKLPATFLFQTWDNRGILQILAVEKEKEPQCIRVRYKLIGQRRQGKSEAESANKASGDSQEEVIKKILSYEKKYVTSITKYTRTYGEPGKQKRHVEKCVYSSKGRFHRLDSVYEDKAGARDISNGESSSRWQFSDTDKIGMASIEALTKNTSVYPYHVFFPFTFYSDNFSDVPLSVESGEDELIHLGWKGKGLDIEATYRPEQDSLLPVEYVSSYQGQDGPKRAKILRRYEYEGLALKKITDPDSEEKDTYTITDVNLNPQFPDGYFDITFRKGTPVTDVILGIECHFGSLRDPRHTQEDSAVTTILNSKTEQKQASGTNEVFGPVAERVINIMAHRTDCFIDLDTGRLLSITDDFRPHVDPGPRPWLEKRSIDASVRTEGGLCGLWTVNTVAAPVSNERWDTITPAACHRVLKEAKGVYSPIMSAEGKLPATFLFQTWDNRGILQILAVEKQKEPQSIRVRYKLIQKAKAKNQSK
ncbi:MAG: hypothetical protein ACYTBJ_07465 [Planctomycetota bacterium]